MRFALARVFSALACALALVCVSFPVLAQSEAPNPDSDRKVLSAEAKLVKLRERLAQAERSVVQADSVRAAARALLVSVEDTLRALTQYERQLGENTFSQERQSREQVRSADDKEVDSLRAEYKHRERSIDALYKGLEKRFKDAHRLYDRARREEERAKQRVEKAGKDLKAAQQDLKRGERDLAQARKDVVKRHEDKERTARDKEQRAKAKERARQERSERRERARRERAKSKSDRKRSVRSEARGDSTERVHQRSPE